MKNIWKGSIEKSTNLLVTSCDSNDNYLYITSDEKIIDTNCYVINVVGDNDEKRYVFKPILVNDDIVRKEKLVTYPNGGWCEKIILTTDPKLIADGVQAICDDFLFWYKYCPGCEFVKIKSEIKSFDKNGFCISNAIFEDDSTKNIYYPIPCNEENESGEVSYLSWLNEDGSPSKYKFNSIEEIDEFQLMEAKNMNWKLVKITEINY